MRDHDLGSCAGKRAGRRGARTCETSRRRSIRASRGWHPQGARHHTRRTESIARRRLASGGGTAPPTGRVPPIPSVPRTTPGISWFEATSAGATESGHGVDSARGSGANARVSQHGATSAGSSPRASRSSPALSQQLHIAPMNGHHLYERCSTAMPARRQTATASAARRRSQVANGAALGRENMMGALARAWQTSKLGWPPTRASHGSTGATSMTTCARKVARRSAASSRVAPLATIQPT